MAKTVNLGAEHDNALQRALSAVMREMGANLDDPSWAVGGSQEIVTCSAIVAEKVITFESETYVGLTLSGDAEVVDEIATRTWRKIGRT